MLATSRPSTTSLPLSKLHRLQAMPTSIQSTRIRALQTCSSMALLRQERGQLSAEAPKRPLLRQSMVSQSLQETQTASLLPQSTTLDSAHLRVTTSKWPSKKYTPRIRSWNRRSSTNRWRIIGEANLSRSLRMLLEVTISTTPKPQTKSKMEKSFLRRLIISTMTSRFPKRTKKTISERMFETLSQPRILSSHRSILQFPDSDKCRLIGRSHEVKMSLVNRERIVNRVWRETNLKWVRARRDRLDPHQVA